MDTRPTHGPQFSQQLLREYRAGETFAVLSAKYRIPIREVERLIQTARQKERGGG